MYSSLISLAFFLLASIGPSVGLGIALAPLRPARAFLERPNVRRAVSVSGDEGGDPPLPVNPPFINSRRSVLLGSVAAGFSALWKGDVASAAAGDDPCRINIGEPVTPGDELPAATEKEIEELHEKGYNIVVACPSLDFKGDNELATVYVAVYENGCEITLLFLDEDRPNQCEDCLYDAIRRPLFGRHCDIESVFIINDEMVFPGTYSGEQVWGEKTPSHGEKSIQLDQFDRHGEEQKIILWVNTWNHLLGEKNNNPDIDITYQHALPAGSNESKESKDFKIRKGSRNEVDARYKGLMTSVSKVMTKERQKALGKRLFLKKSNE
eukprot:CAMPEP_0194312440 /NCGR_PEP_ID=MMETSP0171-20130528/9361_1 /TAXON_ID=218684 /ORGANISM="Corethron pennatum, Strain L29A3" /LENGTH=323 /DNA_ID=CAMNT_0039066949 /DNA_START=186 /DNA_END=1157 /DNA_ORIENTATION=-